MVLYSYFRIIFTFSLPEQIYSEGLCDLHFVTPNDGPATEAREAVKMTPSLTTASINSNARKMVSHTITAMKRWSCGTRDLPGQAEASLSKLEANGT